MGAATYTTLGGGAITATGAIETVNTNNTPIVAKGEEAAGNVAMQIYNNSAVDVANTITYSMNCKTSTSDRTAGAMRSGFTGTTDATRKSFMDFYTAIGGAFAARFRIADDGGLFAYNLKAGTDQTDAGASVDEIYINTSNQTLRLGV